MSCVTLFLQIFIPLAVCGLWGAETAMRVHHNFHSQHAEDLRFYVYREECCSPCGPARLILPQNTIAIAMRVPTPSRIL